MPELLCALDALLQEHRRWGQATERHRRWMAKQSGDRPPMSALEAGRLGNAARWARRSSLHAQRSNAIEVVG